MLGSTCHVLPPAGVMGSNALVDLDDGVFDGLGNLGEMQSKVVDALSVLLKLRRGCMFGGEGISMSLNQLLFFFLQ